MLRPSHPFSAAAVLALFLTGCPVAPPASQIPSAQSALDRIRATGACGTGVQAAAKIDHFGEQGRVRGDLLMFVSEPARIRMDIVSPFGVTLATLASDGQKFSLADLREKRFYVGPASACNIARLTTVPIPGHALALLLRGQPPVLKHDPSAATLAWSGKGYYVVRVKSTRDASEELHIAPHPADFGKPWSEQRMRLLDVSVSQYGGVLYHAELVGHAPAETGKPRVDPDGIDPPIPPSGPQCSAEIPRRIHVEVPDQDEDVMFRYENVTWNPPIPDGTFEQAPIPGMPVVPVTCE
jgi:outer membrane lipoprotein-sorting protein